MHEYFTAKDFPIITNNTNLGDINDANKKGFTMFIPLPFIGDISINKLAASQGYSVELNDMHGKLTSVKQYGQNELGGLLEEPLHSIDYHYDYDEQRRKDPVTSEWIYHNVVNSKQPMLDENFTVEEMEAGVDAEFFMDMRESFVKSGFGGVNVNIEGVGTCPFPFFCLPLPAPWPNVSTSRKVLMTATTNKIIHRSGFLNSVVVNDNGSIVKTNNVAYDAISGQPLITSLNTEYDELKYNTTIPGHWHYSRMGPASHNAGSSFTLVASQPYFDGDGDGTNDYNNLIETNASQFIDQHLLEGDEYIAAGIYKFNNEEQVWESLAHLAHNAKVTLLSKDSDKAYFHIMDSDLIYDGSEGNNLLLELKVIRSGNRNLISNTIGNIEGFLNPAEPGNIIERDIGEYSQLFGYFDADGDVVRERHFSYPDVIDDLVKFLNIRIAETDGLLEPLNVSQHPNQEFFLNQADCEGNKLYPSLMKHFEKIRFQRCTDPGGLGCCEINGNYNQYGECQVDLNGQGFNNKPFDGYALILTPRTDIPVDDPTERNVYYIPDPETGPSGTKIINFQPDEGNKIRINYLKPDGNIETKTLTFLEYVHYRAFLGNQKVLPNVLNSSAALFSDEIYDEDIDELSFATSLDCNAFAKGKRGIWRQSKSLIYNDRRAGRYDEYKVDSLAEEIEPHLKGVFLGERPIGDSRYNKEFHLFDWNGPNFENWIPQNTITKYDVDGNALESYDAIGVFSSTEYGYNGHLPTSVAVNAGIDEQFFTSAEQGLSGLEEDAKYIGAGLDVDQNIAHSGEASVKLFPGSDRRIRLQIDPKEDYMISAWVKPDAPDEGNLLANSSFDEGLIHWGENGDTDDWVYDNSSSGEVCYQYTGGSYGSLLRRTGISLEQGEIYEITFKYLCDVVPTQFIVKFLTDDAVRNCMVDLNSANGNFDIPSGIPVDDRFSGSINLPFTINSGPGDYILDLYMYYCQDDCNDPWEQITSGFCFTSIEIEKPGASESNTPANYEIVANVYDESDNLLDSKIISSSGLIVEGWEKIEGRVDFSSSNAAYLELELKALDDNNNLKFGYLDDLRIYPVDASMNSFAYDKTNYKLSAELDENNFATFYEYDESGKLFLIKKETEKGIKTLKEVISNLVEKP